MNEKSCPKCGLRLPGEAHFCPRCMYEYPRAEIVQCETKQKKKCYAIIAVGVVAAVFLLLVFLLGQIGNDEETKKSPLPRKEETQRQAAEEWSFRTGEEIPYNDGIEYDLRDCLTNWQMISEKTGPETTEPYAEGEYTVHTVGDVEISVDSAENVKSIYIYYGDSAEKGKYGLYGFCGNSDRDMVRQILGTPEQNYGKDEYFYRFDGLEGAPTLRFSFTDSGVVEEIEYYR